MELENTIFWILDLCSSSGEERDIPTLLCLLEGVTLVARPETEVSS
jgi:hypothetical protein